MNDRAHNPKSERLGCPRENQLNYTCRDIKSSHLQTSTPAGTDVCQSCIDLIVAVAAFRDGGHEYRDHDHSVATRDICAEMFCGDDKFGLPAERVPTGPI